MWVLYVPPQPVLPGFPEDCRLQLRLPEQLWGPTLHPSVRGKGHFYYVAEILHCSAVLLNHLMYLFI